MGKNDKKGSGKPVTDDPRFSGVHSDPRFNLPGRKKGKVQLDERFKAAIRDNDEFKQKTTVDKYGRTVKQDKVQKELKKYANLSDDDLEDKPKKSTKKKKESDSESEDEEESDNEEEEKDSESEEEVGSKVLDRARGEGISDVSESSSEESDSDSDSSSDGDSSSSDEESEEEDEMEAAGVVPTKEKAPTGDETTTFACVNMDWDNIRAVDLMATFSSFVPPKGKLLSVKVFPSEYGKQQMQREEQEGPSREFFEKKKKKKKDVSSDSEEEVTAKSLIEEDTGEEVNSSTLRKYQLQRLQYYYAVITCDSVATARNIYDNCDGTEYESTANFFDLRYVPEGMSFDDEPRDQCEKIPADYKPNSFVTDALQHSKVKLTWDETPAERQKLAEKAFNQKDLDEMDFKAYLASDSDEDEAEDEEEAREKYRSLLGNVFDRANEEEDGNVEITFTPGLDEENKSGDGQEDQDETTIEKYKRKSKERKQARLERMKQKNQTEVEEAPEPTATGKKAKKKAEAEARAKKAAELELLMMDDNVTRAPDEGKNGKRKKGGKPQAEEAEVNLSDPRFQAMFENPDFAIDTTAPQYKKTEAMDKLMEERRRRYNADGPVEKSRKKRKTDSKPAEQNVDALINKLKRNSKK